MCWASAVGEETKAGRAIKVCLFFYFYKLKTKAAFDTGFSLYKTIALHKKKAEIYKHTRKCE